MRDARAEAVARLGGRYDARVLEPSPPAVSEAPWFADDPVGRDRPPNDTPRVLPVAGGEQRWDELIEEDRALTEWCSERWLGAYRRLVAAPPELAGTREALHRLAEQVISPTRELANGKIGLRYTCGGFGTPFFGEDTQLRVRGDELIVQTPAAERAAAITTSAEMAAHVGPELLGGETADAEPLAVDAGASAWLGDWFGFGASVLEELRASVADRDEPSRVQIWPEHFDIAVELGSQRDGARAGYGASPGDQQHPEPYLYVAPWEEVPEGDLWQASGFRGAELPYATLLASPSGAAQRELAVRFLAERLAALTGT